MQGPLNRRRFVFKIYHKQQQHVRPVQNRIRNLSNPGIIPPEPLESHQSQTVPKVPVQNLFQWNLHQDQQDRNH